MTDELDVINHWKHRALTAEKKLKEIKEIIKCFQRSKSGSYREYDKLYGGDLDDVILDIVQEDPYEDCYQISENDYDMYLQGVEND